MISPPHGAELRALDAKGMPLSMEALRYLCQQPIIGNQLTLFV